MASESVVEDMVAWRSRMYVCHPCVPCTSNTVDSVIIKNILQCAKYNKCRVHVESLTCQNYCLSTGCDVHCQAIGQATGYCAFSDDGCVCNCVRSVSAFVRDRTSAVVAVTADTVTSKREAEPQDVSNEKCPGNGDCMFGGQCYSCGAKEPSLGYIVCCGGVWKACRDDDCQRSCCRR